MLFKLKKEKILQPPKSILDDDYYLGRTFHKDSNPGIRWKILKYDAEKKLYYRSAAEDSGGDLFSIIYLGHSYSKSVITDMINKNGWVLED